LLGEWLGGSGGGWQDSGGVWPGIKLITGVPSGDGDPEFGISRGRLMPVHHVFSRDEIPESARKALMDSLVVVHGGMAQNVGPILEMVTEKYLLRSSAEWAGRQDALSVLDEVISSLKRGDIKALGAATTRNFRQPLQAIIPWASNYFTEQLIAKCEAEFGGDFWGFWMLGGMSGGGMGFIFAPHRKLEAQARLQQIMLETKRELSASLPFAMDPVVFDYAINENGTFATLLTDDDALMPSGYYALVLPKLLRTDRSELPASRRTELDKFGAACRTKPELRGMVQTLFDALMPRGKSGKSDGASLHELLEQNGFDRAQHEQIRSDLKEGRIGLAQNRLRADTRIEDVKDEDVARLDLVGQASSPRFSFTGRKPVRQAGSLPHYSVGPSVSSLRSQAACEHFAPTASPLAAGRLHLLRHLPPGRCAFSRCDPTTDAGQGIQPTPVPCRNERRAGRGICRLGVGTGGSGIGRVARVLRAAGNSRGRHCGKRAKAFRRPALPPRQLCGDAQPRPPLGATADGPRAIGHSALLEVLDREPLQRSSPSRRSLLAGRILRPHRP
jgi:hypothetical protein